MNKRLKGAVRLARDVAKLSEREDVALLLDLLIRANASPKEVLVSVQGHMPVYTYKSAFYSSMKKVSDLSKEQDAACKARAQQRRADIDRKLAEMGKALCVMPDPISAPLSS